MIIFDLDGTLSVVGDRLRFLKQSPPDWDAFYAACGTDMANLPMTDLYNDLYNIYAKGTLKVVTGRRESCRNATLTWFKFYGLELDSEDLLMRPDGDHRHDTEVKPELVADILPGITLVFEDRNSMVKKWRELGLTCCQVAEGDF